MDTHQTHTQAYTHTPHTHTHTPQTHTSHTHHTHTPHIHRYTHTHIHMQLLLKCKEIGSGAFSDKMLFVRIIENNKLMLISGQVRLSIG